MNAGFVINGKPEHGIVRATRFLAEALRHVGGTDVAVLETTEEAPDDDSFAKFQSTLPKDAVIVFQASHRTNYIWGPYETRIARIENILRKADRPVALYLHDIYGKGALQNVLEKIRGKLAPKSAVVQGLKTSAAPQPAKSGLLSKILSYEERFMRAVDPYVTRYIVSNEIEKGRLKKFVSANKISVLPHFIESRELPCDRDTAKTKLGLAGRKVVTLLGFIVERKGHEDAIEVLAKLPPDTHLVFAGKGDESYVSKLRALAAAKGVANRLSVTGYLSEEDLNLYMAASDVAVCPFRDVSASGSLATWLSATRPVVAYALPLMKDYQKKFPAQVYLAQKGDIANFAKVVKSLLDNPPVISGDDIGDYSVQNSAQKLATILEGIAQ